MPDLKKIHTSPLCRKEAVVKGDCYRFTVLTPSLIRMEYSENGEFEDRATQSVINRDFDVPEYTVTDKDGMLVIKTECIEIRYTKEKFSPNSLNAHFTGHLGHNGHIWHYGQKSNNLKGTVRTLDGVNGECPLEDGLMSSHEMCILDDSNTLAINSDGWVEVREKSKIDIYLFGYAGEYRSCLKALYRLTGKTPLLPRYALGNWWSRYHAYTQEEYTALMDKFMEKNIPFSVGILDMDWHKVNIDSKYGSGWTGFSWERKLFPEPEKLISYLHKNHLRTALNLHPAEGIAAHEDSYREMAEAMGVDYENEEKVEFDISDPNFLEAYFKHMLYPHEKMGVDFWWMDWQQGNTSKVEGLDPLWMLNHFHYLDNAKDGKRPLIFSRYSGVGSHRYPIGFSGDTFMTWESLDFQPYFTANASNVGYGWWSHDIGGHMFGYRDDELITRWVQFGVFSPIMRLHSTNCIFLGKEPWNYGSEYEKSMSEFLRLRHKLIPYLYSMNYEASYNDSPIIQPLYYGNPDKKEAYLHKNEYFFGTQMIAAPITKKSDTVTGMGHVNVWLPEGEWFDYFNATAYKGGRSYKMYRHINEMPVFVKAGGIIPMAENDGHVNDTSNPEKLRIKVYPGANNLFGLYEDDDNCNGEFALTTLNLSWSEKPRFEIILPEGGNPYAPEKRTYIIEFVKISDADIKVTSDGSGIAFEKSHDGKSLTVTAENVSGNLCVEFESTVKVLANDYKAMIFDLCLKAQTENLVKDDIYNAVCEMTDVSEVYEFLETLDADENLKSAIREILSTI